MVSVLDSSVVDRGFWALLRFKPKTYKNGICCFSTKYIALRSKRIGGVMVSMLASSAVDRKFRSGCFSTKHVTLSNKRKDWLFSHNTHVSTIKPKQILQKGCTRLAAASEVYQLLARGRCSLRILRLPPPLKLVAIILLKVALKHNKSNQINQNKPNLIPSYAQM